MNDQYSHLTVMQNELVSRLNLFPGANVVDCTAGGGGHIELALKEIGHQGHVYAFDRDKDAIKHINSKFKNPILEKRLTLFHAPFSILREKIPVDVSIQAIYADLGVSSPQIDCGERGFSFMNMGKLDMRMSPDQTQISAYDIINSYREEELCRIFREYGEEKKAVQIAQAIVEKRLKKKIDTTLELAETIKRSIKYPGKSKRHPATRVFQALRIFVNDELNELKLLLSQALDQLASGGRLAIISFHSLEDRIVKKFFKEKSGKNSQENLPKYLPLTEKEFASMSSQEVKIVRPFPITPSQEEIDHNPRARSGKLRIVEKI